MTDLGFDRQTLGNLISHLRDNPDAAQTVWKAETEWQSGFRSSAKIGPHTIPMDEPEQLGGSATAPNMVEVVLGAYGCCLTTGYVAQAAKMGIDLRDVRTTVEGNLDLRTFLGLPAGEDASAGYTDIKVSVQLDAPGATREELEELHKAVVATSPVGDTLSRPVNIVATLAAEQATDSPTT